MASITERIRGLVPRSGERRSKSAGERAERAQRRAEAKAQRLEHQRKGAMTGRGDGPGPTGF